VEPAESGHSAFYRRPFKTAAALGYQRE
jgi:hypothetical protein